MTTIYRIENMTNSGVAVTVAILISALEEANLDDWIRVAKLYQEHELSSAQALIKLELGEKYLIDVEACKCWLVASKYATGILDAKSYQEAKQKHREIFRLLRKRTAKETISLYRDM